jgi:hypothetical protein
MRPLLIGLALFSASGFLFAACGQDTGSTTASAGGTGGAPNCENVNFVDGDKDGSEPCDVCLHDYCCAEVAQCRDKGCIDCVNYLKPSCGPKPNAVNDCLYKYCQPICSPGWPPTGSTSVGTGG